MKNQHTYRHMLYGVFIAVALCGVTFAHAQTPSATRDTVREEIQERREEIKDEISERRAEIASSTEAFKEEVAERRSVIAKKIQERLYNLTQNIKGRMEAAIFRLDHIADRIETRTAKLKAERSIDDTQVQAELSRARTALDAATAALATDLGQFAYDENPREAFKETRSTMQSAGGHIREAHGALRDAFAALKASIAAHESGAGVSDAVRQNETASTTSDN